MEITFYTKQSLAEDFIDSFEREFGQDLMPDFLEGDVENGDVRYYFSNHGSKSCNTAIQMAAFWDVFNPQDRTRWGLQGNGNWANNQVLISSDYRKYERRYLKRVNLPSL